MQYTKHLLGACMRDRECWDIAKPALNKLAQDKSYALILDVINKYYESDPTATETSKSILEEMLKNTVRNPRLQTTLVERLSEIQMVSQGVSVANIRGTVLAAQIQEVKDKLAQALVNDNKEQEGPLLAELNRLYSLTSEDDLNASDADEVFTTKNLDGLILKSYDIENMLKVYPTSVGDRIGGGLLPGQHVVLGAVPNLGKSAMVVTMVCGFAVKGHKCLIIGNEEPPAVYWMRFIQQLSRRTKEQVLEDYQAAVVEAKLNGLDNIVIASLSPGTPTQIEGLIRKFNPAVLVIDQILHLNMGKKDSKTDNLEAAGAFSRAMALQYNLVAISVTQAGDSAYGKAVLSIRDLYQSHTGLQGTADVILLLGADAAQEEAGYRTVNIVKNKVNGRHEHFPVKLNIQLSKYLNV